MMAGPTLCLLCLVLLDISAVVSAVTAFMSTDVLRESSEFWYIDGKAISPSQAYVVTNMPSACTCRKLCLMRSECLSFSAVDNSVPPNTVKCLLGNTNVFINTPSDHERAVYGVKKESIAEAGAKRYYDNLYYIKLPAKVPLWEDSLSACSQIPGFRMVAPRFHAQMKIFHELCYGRPLYSSDTSCGTNWFHVHFKKVGDTIMIADTVDIKDTDISSIETNEPHTSVYAYAHSFVFHDVPDTFQAHTVCQANPFGVPW